MKKLLFAVLGILAFAYQAEAGVLDASWIAPTTNTDGSALTDLGSYKLYFVPSPGVPCPGTQFLVVPVTNPAPGPNTAVNQHMTDLKTGTNYTVSVTAVNLDGIESACSTTASANARPTTPTPATGLTVR